jgi:hypothetical protein
MRGFALVVGSLAAVLALTQPGWSQIGPDADRGLDARQIWETAQAAAGQMETPAAQPVKEQGLYSESNFSAFISKGEMAKALQAMVDTAYKVGFRTIGNPDDLFHGHFIFDGKSSRPRFILYHTQERAGLYELYEPWSKLAYTDKTKRNWIQWLDTDKVEDANLYRFAFTKPEWCVAEEAFTINYDMLDPAKLGFVPVVIGEYYQFNFFQIRCKGKENDPESNVISLAMPEGKTLCLEFNDDPAKRYSSNFQEFAQRLGEDRQHGKNLSTCPDTSSPAKP